MSLKLKIENQIVEVSKRFKEVSALLNVLVGNDDENFTEEIELSSTFVTLEIFEYIRKYYEYNNFAPKPIQGGTIIADQLFINHHDKEMMLPIDPFKGDLLKRLIQAAVYLNMPAFKKLCLARIYYEFQYDPSDPKSLEKLQTKFPEVKPLTIQDVEEYKKHYPQICQEFK